MTSESEPWPSQASASTAPPSVLLVDDHPLYREALAGLLRRACDEPLGIAEAPSAEKALQLASVHPRIGLVVIDLNLPGAQGAEAIGRLRQQLPVATIVVVSGSEQRRDIQAAMRAGARVFISKAVAPADMLRVLKRVLRAQVHAQEVIMRDLTDEVYVSTKASRLLTRRQREVLLLMSMGHTNKDIGLHLRLAEITVKQHVSRILSTLGVSNRTQAVTRARGMALDMSLDEAPLSRSGAIMAGT